MTESGGRQNEALEKLNQGIEESRKAMQRQTMGLAQEYFDDSVESLKQQVEDSREALESLPEQLPGGQEESFQMLFQELMDGYTRIEGCLEEARAMVSGLDTESLRRQGEASDAALREAEELGLDLDEVRGTGSGGRVVAGDVRSDEERQTGRIEATDAARREARERGIDLTEVEATGAEGQIIVSDVVEFAAKRGGAETENLDAGEEASTSGVTDETDETGVTDMADLIGGADAPVETGVVDETGGTVEALQDGLTASGWVEEIPNGGPAGAEEAAGGATQAPARVTSAAQRKAQELGVDLSRIEGSGVGGLVTLKDVVESPR